MHSPAASVSAHVLSGYAKLSDIAEAAAPERSRSVTSLLLEKKGKRGEEAQRAEGSVRQEAMSSLREAGRNTKTSQAGKAKFAE